MTTTDKSPSRKSGELGPRPMWCDGFDMDLPAVIPDAREIVGEVGDVLLWTSGHATHGALNHPCVWNHEQGLIAFFGFRSPARPSVYHTSSGEVRCTVWEAFRDAWPHTLVMLVEQRPVWDTCALRPQFETIMYDLRGWRSDALSDATARDVVRRSLREATSVMHEVVARHPSGVERWPDTSTAEAGVLADG